MDPESCLVGFDPLVGMERVSSYLQQFAQDLPKPGHPCLHAIPLIRVQVLLPVDLTLPERQQLKHMPEFAGPVCLAAILEANFGEVERFRDIAGLDSN